VTAVKQDCACLCGASRFTVAGNPIGRFFCHCTICQKVYGKPFADVAYFRADAVAPPVGQPVEFRRYRPPPAIRRGICERCRNPVVGFLTMAPGLTVAFVPSQNFPRPAELPEPDRHIFYHRRVANIADSVPKLSGYWPSLTHVTRTILADLFQRRGAA